MRKTSLVRWAALTSTVMMMAGCRRGTAQPSSGRPGAGGTAGTGAGGGGGGTGASPTDVTGIFNFSFPPATPLPPVGGRVRVVNLYQPGIEAPFAIDIVQQGLLTRSKPLLTVQPGTASDYFDPGDSGDGSTNLAFYRSGSTQSVDEVMEQGWGKMKGRQITIVLLTSNTPTQDPTSTASPTVRAYGAAYVVEERGGDNPRPTPEAGKGLLWIDTQPLNELPSGTGWGSPAVGTSDGTCLLALGDQGGGGYSFIQAQHAFSFAPGPVSLNVYDKISNKDECKGTPVYGPITATIEAGRESVAIIYGTDVKALKTLVLPIAQ